MALDQYRVGQRQKRTRIGHLRRSGTRDDGEQFVQRQLMSESTAVQPGIVGTADVGVDYLHLQSLKELLLVVVQLDGQYPAGLKACRKGQADASLGDVLDPGRPGRMAFRIKDLAQALLVARVTQSSSRFLCGKPIKAIK
jgi:hypothetical protein